MAVGTATVRDALDVSDSVLSKHLGALEAAAYLRRRRLTRKPFARVYTAGGGGATHSPETEAGRELFLAAARLIDTAR